MISIRRSACVAMVSLGLASCGVQGQAIPAGYTLGTTGEAVVIGRGEVYYRESGETDVAFLWLTNDTTGKTYRVQYDGSHEPPLYFYIALGPGPHRVIGWDNMNRRGRVNGRFDVTAGQVIYIGTLRFTPTSKAPSIYAEQPGRFSVIDDYAQAVQSFRKYYPEISRDVEKSLIRLEAE